MNVNNGGDTVELKEETRLSLGEEAWEMKRVRWSKPHPRWVDLTMHKQLKWC